SRPPGQQWTWAGYLINRFKYPNDPRLSSAVGSYAPPAVLAVRNFQGRKYLYLTDQYSHHLTIYRFDGEITVPAGFLANGHVNNWLPGIQPAQGRWTWRDLNGDGDFQSNEFLEADGGTDESVWGWDIDNYGDIWAASESYGIRRLPIQGFDAYANP